ncbi:uncharacterized protein [Onthophagus taurus]|uniref:uncharacterized protein isoform X1 n=1 Tax=Onthophagus taurus TaxID=166361 RepID=UPI000C20C9C1|nr:uncharacterized protein LOC111422562 isoform X1 [Onthophagus taurus]
MFKGGFSRLEKGCGIGEELDGSIVSYTLKIIERSKSIYFFRNILGMRVICHREYEQGNNLRNDLNINHDSCWSSTILSYGKEHNYLNLELIYIYNKKSYLTGNIFKGMTIRCSRCLKRAKTLGWPVLPGNILQSPGGYLFYILDEPQPIRTDPIVKISLAVADLKASKAFYNGLIGFRFCENYYQASNPNIAILGLQQFDAKLELTQNEGAIKGENTGILGVGAEYNEQIALEERFINKKKENIIIPLIPMDTPDKSTMAIFKVKDPDGHEIIFYEFTPYQNVFQYSPEDESRMVKLFEDDEIPEDNKNWDSKKSFGKKTSKSRLSKEVSCEAIKLKIKEITRSLGSMRPHKSKDSQENLEDDEPEAGGSSKVEKCPTTVLKGISRSLGSIKDFGRLLKSRSDMICCKDCKDKQEKLSINKDEANHLGDKTISRSEQIYQEDESNAQDSVATQEPVAIEVQASAKKELKMNRGVSNEANKSAQYTGLRIKTTSRGTNSEQRLVDSTTEDDLNQKSFKSTFTCANNPFKEDVKCVNIKCDDTKNIVKDSIKNLLRKTSSLIRRSNNEQCRKSEDLMVDGHLYFNANFDIIPPYKIPSFVKSETSKTSAAEQSENQEVEKEN